jgi:hypothetical protein
MSLSNRVIKVSYTANGSTDSFAFPDVPIVDDSAEIVVYIRDESTDPVTVTLQSEGALNDYILTGAPDANSFHTNVQFNTAPASGLIVVIFLTLPTTQLLDINPNQGIPPAQLELALDRLVGMVQQIEEKLTRVPLLGPTEQVTLSGMTMPEPLAGGLLGWDATADALRYYTAAELLAASGGGVPAGGDQYALLEKLSSTDGDADWSDPIEYDGFSSRFNATFTSAGIKDTLDKIIAITYTAPLISLSASGSGTIREKGDAVTSSTLTAAITKRSDPIAEVRFYQNPSTLLDTQTSGGGIPNGGNSTYAWTGSFSDNTTFRAEVEDDGSTGGPTTVTATASFTFVYPYYVGAGAAGLTAAAVAALTKRIITSSASRNETITAGAGEVFYFAYPASYGALTSILDVNGFETFPDWTLRTENITGLDGNPVSYRIYEFDNPVSAGSYEYTFIR